MAIEWTEETWNPVTGCDRISPGCAHCYARTMARRLKAMGNPRYQLDGDGLGFGVQLHPDKLDEPLRRRRPTTYFVNSMSDLFHEQIPDEFVALVFATMWFAHWHTFQVLTKRPERMRELLTNPFWWACVEGAAQRRVYERTGEDTSYTLAVHGPLPNVWIGVSIENARYTWRADVLREIPAAVRFISAEPLLGSLVKPRGQTPANRHDEGCAKIDGLSQLCDCDNVQRMLDLTGINWLIIGGESGPGARPMWLKWAEELLAACRASGVAPFVKQLGARPVANGGQPLRLRDRKGGDPDEWPEALRVREYPMPRSSPESTSAALSFELSAEYCELAARRLSHLSLLATEGPASEPA